MTERVIVSVKEGKLRGTKNKSKLFGTEFYSFYGVPYGESTEHSRFKDPVKARPWRGIRDATTESRGGCSQFSLHLYEIAGSEDCLYNNIHTLKLPSEGEPLKPVIFYIHAGRLLYGSPESWHHGSPDYVMHHDVVYVCIAFRLHILGFLNLNLKECSGNQGLKDVILGLQWTKENIHKFNGDPNNITIIGNSSAGTMVNLLLMSPAAKGLFHKAVITFTGFLTYATYKDENETAAFEIARMLGFQGTDRKKLLRFLKGISADVLIPTEREYERTHDENTVPVFPQSIFLPTIDSASENPVVPVSPRKLIDSITPVPLIFGACDRESIFGFTTERARLLTEQNYKIGYRQNDWGWMRALNDEEMEMLNHEIEAFYLKDYPNGKAPLSVMVDMITAIAFHDLYDTLINPIAGRLPSSVFIYKFQFESETGKIKRLVSSLMNETLSGTYHGDDIGYWCKFEKEKSPRAVQMIKTYTEMITTFAKNGDPNYEKLGLEWRPTTIDEPCYLSINDKMQMVDGELFNDNGSVEFWKNIKKRFRKT